MSATAERDGLSLIAVTMKNASADERSADITAMLNYGFANYKVCDITEEIKTDEVAVLLGAKEKVKTQFDGDGKIVCRKNDEMPEVVIDIAEEIKAPVEVGQGIGFAEVKIAGETVKTIEIVATERVDKLSLKEIFVQLMSVILSR